MSQRCLVEGCGIEAVPEHPRFKALALRQPIARQTCSCVISRITALLTSGEATTLSLAGTRLDDEDCRALARLIASGAPFLKRLYIYDDALTCTGEDYITAAVAERNKVAEQGGTADEPSQVSLGRIDFFPANR